MARVIMPSYQTGDSDGPDRAEVHFPGEAPRIPAGRHQPRATPALAIDLLGNPLFSDRGDRGLVARFQELLLTRCGSGFIAQT